MTEIETPNQAPPASSFCPEPAEDPKSPIIRIYGGLTLTPQLDPTRGATSCSSSLGLLSKLESALAPLGPIFTTIDAVASIGQCLLLMKEAITNPLKAPDLLKCIPGMVAKLNKLLALIPPFPQGVIAMLQMVLDILTTIETELDCVVQQLTAIDQEIQQATRYLTLSETIEDDLQRQGLIELAECGRQNAESRVASAMESLTPMLRILCTVRTFLALTGDKGKEIAKRLSLPDVRNISALEEAIAIMATFRNVIREVVNLVETIGQPLGLEPPPEPFFVCPLDADPSLLDTTPSEPVPVPKLDLLTPATGSHSAIVDLQITVLGEFLSAQTQIYIGTSQLDTVSFTSLGGNTANLVVTVPLGILQQGARTYQITALNLSPTVSDPFSGIASSPSAQIPTDAQTSNQLTFSVT
jgi:hypothetical protein